MSHKTPWGTWRVRWKEGDGGWQSKTFEKKVEADVFEAQVHSGLVPKKTHAGITFEKLAWDWHKNYCQVNKAVTQWREDESVIRRYLLPTFGDTDLEDLKLRDLVALQASLKRQGKLRPKSINLITGLAQKILEDSVSWEYLPANPFRRLKKLTLSEQEFLFWTFEERDRFLNFCRHKDPELFELVLFASNTGMRIGEIQGLYRDCLDFDRKEISVRRSFSPKVKQLFEHTKSKKIRRVPMNPAVFEILKIRRMMAPTQQVFEMSFHNLRRRFHRMCDIAQVKRIRIHDLRHTFASHMAAGGVALIVIKELLGHADIKMTMRYAHLAPDMLQGTTDLLSPKLVSNVRTTASAAAS